MWLPPTPAEGATISWKNTPSEQRQLEVIDDH
jgi:hypothetical protein